MATQGKLRAYHLKPYDENISQAHADFLDWVQTTLNTLVGQRLATGNAAQGFAGLQNPSINPITQITSQGGRVSAVSSVAELESTTNTSANFYWDGTHGSNPFILYRDNGIATTPVVSSQSITNLVAGSLYNFYPYYDESLGTIKFAFLPGFVGTPGFALLSTNPNFAALDKQARQIAIAANHIPLWTLQTNLTIGGETVGPPFITVNTNNRYSMTTRAGSGY